MQWICFVVLLALGAVACGEGPELVEVCVVEHDMWLKEGSTSDPGTWPSQENIVGSYWLDKVEIELFADGVYRGFITGDDLGTWSGTLELEESTATFTVTVEGESATLSGPYTRIITDAERGLFSIDDPSGTYEYNYVLEERCDLDCRRGLNWYPTEPFCEITKL